MREPADCVADAFFDLNFAPSGSSHLFDNIRRDFQAFKRLLRHGIRNGL